MEQTVLLLLAVAIVFFVWVWIGSTLFHRIALEQKIERLQNIENRLPEEQRSLDNQLELRAIERSKIGSAKFIVVLFGVLLLASLVAALFDSDVQQLFGFGNLKVFSYFAVVALAFIVLPTFVGLTLAGGGRSKPVTRKVAAESKGVAS